jgi:CRP-like cAMP-binding protein
MLSVAPDAHRFPPSQNIRVRSWFPTLSVMYVTDRDCRLAHNALTGGKTNSGKSLATRMDPVTRRSLISSDLKWSGPLRGVAFMPTTAPATSSSGPSNLLLAMLDATSLSLLEPHLRDITLKQYDILQDADAPIQYVYFPVTAMISLLAILETGEAIEIAAIGREGAVGTKFGARPQLSFARAIVQLAGTVLRIDISQFHQAATRSSAIADLAMSANDVLVANLQQSAACNAIHGLEARLARWLLHARDRHDSDTLPLTQEFLSEMLGVRRTTVTLAARMLQNAGVIRYRRGHIKVLDREGLEAVSCECYGVVRRNIARVLRSEF